MAEMKESGELGDGDGDAPASGSDSEDEGPPALESA